VSLCQIIFQFMERTSQFMERTFSLWGVLVSLWSVLSVYGAYFQFMERTSQFIRGGTHKSLYNKILQKKRQQESQHNNKGRTHRYCVTVR